MIPNHKVREPISLYDPPVYRCCYTSKSLDKLDGDVSKVFWQQGEWITDFHDIEGDSHPLPYKPTRVKMLWNEDALYIGAYLTENTIWATVKNRDDLIYIDNDFEVFLAPQDSTHRYFEIEINAAGAVWDLYMNQPQRDNVHRLIGWDVHGLESAVKIDGMLNDPYAENKGWSVEMKIPWFSLRECELDSCYPTHFAPQPAEIWRLEFSRVEYEVDQIGSQYVKRKDLSTGLDLPEHNWVWAPTGVIDAHMPERWGYLIFTQHGEDYALPSDEKIKLLLRKLYYREHRYSCEHMSFSTDLSLLLADETEAIARYDLKAYITPSLFEGIAFFEGHTYHIREDGYFWKE